jgi:hypothetical protein
MHEQSTLFLTFVKSILGEYFTNKTVLDVGSGDKDTNNKFLFDNCVYHCNDLVQSPNVTVISQTKDLSFSDETFDTIISKHHFHLDANYKETLKKIYEMLKPNGLFLFTCGTTTVTKKNILSLNTQLFRGAISNIKNIENIENTIQGLMNINDLHSVLNLNELFSSWNSYYNSETCDLYFVGVKKNTNLINNIDTKLFEYNALYVHNINKHIINFTLTNIKYSNKKYKYTAVIVEPRCHQALSFVLLNFCENLSDDWGFIIYHGCNNKSFLEDIINNELEIYKNRIVKLVNLNVDNLTNRQYNQIMKCKYFYDNIETEIFLIFQIDSLIIKENKNIINEFLNYDYVGAPWKNEKVGNGGLSLRKKSKILEIIEKVDPDFKKNEDEYFSLQNVVDLYCPSYTNAQQFSVETVFNKAPFGVHNCYNYLDNDEWSYLTNKYPDLITLRELNTIKKYTDLNYVTIVYTNDEDDLVNLEKSLLSLLMFVNLNDIHEIIIYIHNRIQNETYDLIERLKINHVISCKVIPLHYNFHGFLKQKVVGCNSYEISDTKYIALLDCNTLFTKSINFKNYIVDDKINWDDLYKYDSNVKPFLFTKNSLHEASIYFKGVYNYTYEDFCQIKSDKFCFDLFKPFPENCKNIFNGHNYLIDYCENYSSEYYLSSYYENNTRDYIENRKTVIFVFTHKVCNLTTDKNNNFWGIGDMIRGLICVYQLSKKHNFNLIVDYQLHSIGELLNPIKHKYKDYILRNKDSIVFVQDAEKYILNNNDNLMYFFTNDYYNEGITDECQTFIKNILMPNKKFKEYINDTIKIYKVPSEYNILHFRLGDDLLVRNKQNNFTQLKELIRKVNGKNDILISDSKDFKNYIKNTYPNIFQFDLEITHTGLNSNTNSIRDTLFEFFIATTSQNIKSYSVYNHTSGFVKIAKEIYNVNLIKID